jgi:hypothetical protein
MQTESTQPRAARKAYHQPRLEVYGQVNALTQTGTGTPFYFDGGYPSYTYSSTLPK